MFFLQALNEQNGLRQQTVECVSAGLRVSHEGANRLRQQTVECVSTGLRVSHEGANGLRQQTVKARRRRFAEWRGVLKSRGKRIR